MSSSTRARVRSETPPRRLSTLDTVGMETPADSAMYAIVTAPGSVPGSAPARSSVAFTCRPVHRAAVLPRSRGALADHQCGCDLHPGLGQFPAPAQRERQAGGGG